VAAGFPDRRPPGQGGPDGNDPALDRTLLALADLIAGDEVWRDSHSLKTLNAAAHLVQDNQRLTAKLEEQLAEVQASRERIVSASDAERRRWSCWPW
jgi:hypothetical protein